MSKKHSNPAYILTHALNGKLTIQEVGKDDKCKYVEHVRICGSDSSKMLLFSCSDNSEICISIKAMSP